MDEQLAALLARAVVHRDRTRERWGQDSFQYKAAQRAVASIEGSAQ